MARPLFSPLSLVDAYDLSDSSSHFSVMPTFTVVCRNAEAKASQPLTPPRFENKPVVTRTNTIKIIIGELPRNIQ